MGYEQGGSQEVTEAAPLDLRAASLAASAALIGVSGGDSDTVYDAVEMTGEQCWAGLVRFVALLQSTLAERDRQIATYVSPCGKPGHHSNHAGDTRDLSGSTFYCVQCAELAEKDARIAQLRSDLRAMTECKDAWKEVTECNESFSENWDEFDRLMAVALQLESAIAPAVPEAK